jgi:RHS repeat-associated protein
MPASDPGPEAASNSAISIAELSLPKAGGSVGYGENFRRNPFTGAAQFSVPIATPLARGVDLGLSLDYASGAVNGPFGLGFGLERPSISVRTSTGIPRYDGHDTFVYGDEVLVPACVQSGGAWQPVTRQVTESGIVYAVSTYLKRSGGQQECIERWQAVDDATCFWRVTDASNGLSEFGRSALARIADPAEPGHIYRWLVESQVDGHGNRIVYTYVAEDTAGLNPPESWYGNSANRYLQRVRYGNFMPVSGAETFAFEVIFDYGERDLDQPTIQPQHAWALRPDPLSSFRAGFEIRTCRRCAGILVTHFFPDPLGTAPVITGVYQFGYEVAGHASLLSAIAYAGWRQYAGEASPRHKPQPPIRLTYGAWQPEKQRFQPLAVAAGAPIPGMLGSADLQLVDLYGQGLPGMLSTEAGQLRYWRPCGDGRFAPGLPPPEFPVDIPTGDRTAALMDIEGNGRLDLLVGAFGRAGYYGNRNDGSWAPFTPLPAMPIDFSDPRAALADLSGSGRADLLASDQDLWRVALSKGREGYGTPYLVPAPRGNARYQTADEANFTGFADVFGDGLSHLVRVTDGSVTVWPNLGYGRFAAPRQIRNAPAFPAGVARRAILLADLSGSGAADLILVMANAILVYENCYGNAFAAPRTIPLPNGFADTDQIFAADVLGVGASAIVVSQARAAAGNLFYDATGGGSPLLLHSIDNGIGGMTDIRYRSSTAYALEDEAAGQPWVTTLPMPVQVVAEVDHRDRIDNVTQCEIFQYRDGYYDPVEREFRGFGFVQSQDSTTMNASLWRFPSATAPPPQIQPLLRRSWNYTGAECDSADILAQLAALYFQGDPAALTLPGPWFDPAIVQAGPQTLRQAFMALAGLIYRTEDFGVDPQGEPGAAPLRVEQNAYRLTLVQPAIAGRYAVFQIHKAESAATIYEGAADDPRTEHQLGLRFDTFGQAVRSMRVGYRRRASPTRLPAQSCSLITVETRGLINHVGDRYDNASGSPVAPLKAPDTATFRLIGTPFEMRSYEIGGAAESNSYFTWDVADALADTALQNAISYGVAFTPGLVQARLFNWEQNLYWDDAQGAALALQHVSARALLHHKQAAVMPDALVATVYGNRVDKNLLETEGGYQAQDSHWWSWGYVTGFYGAAQYFQQMTARDPFGNLTSIEYDAYQLFVTVRHDPNGHASTTLPDYWAMKPARVTDVNGVIEEALYDPLAQIMVTSLYRKAGGAIIGDAPLADYHLLPAPDTGDILASPEKYLQGAGLFMHQDLAQVHGQPPLTLMIERHAFLHPEGQPSPGASPYGVSIAYFDSFLRQVQLARLVSGEPPFSFGLSSCRTLMAVQDPASWVVDVRLRFDSRGSEAFQYLKYFTATPAFVAAPAVPFQTSSFDALGRKTGILTPKGFLSRQSFTPWATIQSDEDDTVTQSPYYIAHIHDPALPPAERQALEKAAVFEDTPRTEIVDPYGRLIQVTEIAVEAAGGLRQTLADYRWLDASGNGIAQTDPRFYNAADPDKPQFFTSLATFDMAGQAIASASADAGDQPLSSPQASQTMLMLQDALGTEIRQWTPRGFAIARRFNSMRQLLEVHIAGNGLDQIVECRTYGSDPAKLTVDRLVTCHDQAGVLDFPGYALCGEPLGQSRRYRVDYASEANWNDPATVPLEAETWTVRYAYDAVGSVLETEAPNGAVAVRLFYRNAWPRSLELVPVAPAAAVFAVAPIFYNAAGSPAVMTYGNGVVSSYSYEPTTCRLISIHSVTSDATVLQDLTYTYDPVGNVTYLANPLSVPGDQSGVSGDGDYTYDSLYRVIAATGRHDTGVMARYALTYDYDHSGNLTRIADVSPPAWSRVIDVSTSSNHAVPSAMASIQPPDSYFDASGNLTALESGASLAYDAREVLSQATAGSSQTFFQSGFAGERARKVAVTTAATNETLYLGEVLIERQTQPQASPSALSFRLGVNGQYAMVARFDAAVAPSSLTYMLEDRIWSVGLELDGTGAMLAYEEYQPYGERAVARGAQQDTQRYRFTQQELDPETGLYSIGARYYIPSQGRWSSPDPAGPVDGLNLFMFARGNPVTKHDVTGNNTTKPNEGDSNKHPPGQSFKYFLKGSNSSMTILNASIDAIVLSMEKNHTFHYPPAIEHIKNITQARQAALSPALMSKLAFTGAVGGLTGSIYYAYDIKKNGLDLHNVGMLSGNLLFMREGFEGYRAFLKSGDALHQQMKFAAKFGFYADYIKAASYLYRASFGDAQPGDLGNALGYSLLGTGNYLTYKGAKAALAKIDLYAKANPSQIVRANLMRTAINPASLLLAGIMAFTMPTFIDKFFGDKSAKKK